MLPSLTRTRLYWICQLAGWAVGVALFVALAALTGGIERGPTPTEYVAALIQSYALCVAATHGIHAVASRRQWRTLPLRALVPRLLAAAVVAGVAAQLLGTAVSWAVNPWVAPDRPYVVPPLAGAANGALTLSGLFIGWATVYALAVAAFRLADAERDRLHLRAALAESRTRALEYQLNPHFLFNALNTVRALIRDEPDEARRAVTLLSGLLRRTLVAGRETTHPLADELALVETYLDLEALRFEDRLRVRVNVSEAARAVAVPALLLQTLVENAVKHGVARRREGGEITVHGAVEDRRLRLAVENPVASCAAPDPDDGTQTGLANARERLALLFGAEATLDLEVGPSRAVATVTLPATLPPSDA